MPLERLAEKSIIELVDENVCFLISRKETNNNGETTEVLHRVSLDSLIKTFDAKSAFAKKQTIFINGVPLYPVTFVDIDSKGNAYLREDGSGDYLLYVPTDGIPRVKYMGNAVIDKVTGVNYNLSVSNGVATLKEIV